VGAHIGELQNTVPIEVKAKVTVEVDVWITVIRRLGLGLEFAKWFG
jgi:hypothetical protein